MPPTVDVEREQCHSPCSDAKLMIHLSRPSRGRKTGGKTKSRLRNGQGGAVIRVASRQAAQNPGNGDSCGTYVVVNQHIPDNRLRKSAQSIIGK